MSIHTLQAQKLVIDSQDAATVAEGNALLAEAQIHATLALADAQADTARATEELARQQHLTAQTIWLGGILDGVRRGDTVTDPTTINRLAAVVLAAIDRTPTAS